MGKHPYFCSGSPWCEYCNVIDMQVEENLRSNVHIHPKTLVFSESGKLENRKGVESECPTPGCTKGAEHWAPCSGEFYRCGDYMENEDD